VVRRWLNVALAIVVAGLLAGVAGAIEIAGSTVAHFRWDPAPGPVRAYLVYVSRNGGPFGTFPEQFVPQPFADVHGVPGERIVVGVAVLGSNFEFGPLSTLSLPVRFVTTPSPPRFTVSTDELLASVLPDFEPPTAQVSVVNGGGGTLRFQVRAGAPWLSVTPSSGESSVDEVPIRVTFHASSLEPGEYFSSITLTAQGAGGSVVIPVRLLVEPQIPRFTISDSRISVPALVGQAAQDAIVTLTSSPLGHGYSIMTDMEWLSLSSDGGTTSTPDDPITLSIDATGFARGTYSGHVYLIPSDERARALSTDVTLTVVDPEAPRRVGLDTNRDFKADLIWRDRITGDIQVWLMNGGLRLASARLASPFPFSEWRLAGTGDFDGDGRSDIVWQNTRTGVVIAWYMNGVARTAIRPLLPNAMPGWNVAGVDDFNGDGRADLLLHQPSLGALAIFLLRNTVSRGVIVPNTEGVSVQSVQATGDFDASGTADIAWKSAAGSHQLWLSNADTGGRSTMLNSPPEAGWGVLAAGDADGDGKSDLIWGNDRLREATLWRFESPALIDVQALPSMRRPGWGLATSADLDGDGESDLLWRSAATGQSTVWFMEGARIRQGVSLASPPPANWEIEP
jgi:hypothetical protein